MIKISVIIPTYNRAKMLPLTLESFINQNYPKDFYEIVVVDNNSSDNTKEIVHSFADAHLVSITYLFEKRQGVHYARNSAIKIANFDLLYYTDDDMIADNLLLKEIIKPFELDANVGAATGTVLPKWEVNPPSWVLKHCQNSWLSLFTPPADFLIGTDRWCMNSCHEAIKKEALIKAGGFHPENTIGLWVGDGETGTNWRIKELGYKFAYIRSSIIYHIIPASRMNQKYLNKRLSNEGRCNSFFENKRDPTMRGIIFRFLFRNMLNSPKMYLSYLKHMIFEFDLSYLRLIFAYSFFIYQRSWGDIQFLCNAKYRNLVTQDNYLE
jgi:glucosyl-dolichyl phosphate glucuronosyltransferase